MLFGFVVLTSITVLFIVAKYQLGLAEAIYETLRLFTFQTSLPFPRGDGLGEVIFFVTPLLGLALIFQGVLNLGRLLLDKSSRREIWQVALASTHRDHVIVCGLGRVGFRVVTQLLEAGYDPVVIDVDWNTEFAAGVMARGVPLVLGDAREAAVLRQARIARARAIVCAVNNDLLNTEIGLTARAIAPNVRVVLRIFNEDLDRSLERTLSQTAAFSASGIAAPTIAAAAVSREVDYVIPVDHTLLGITQLVNVPHDALAGNEQIRLIDQVAATGRTIVLGRLPALEALRLQQRSGAIHTPLQRPSAQFDTVIVCGMGKVGMRVVHQLMQMQPRPRIVGVRLPGENIALAPKTLPLDDVTIVEGDARNPDVLERAGLARAYSVAAVTSDDLINLQVGLAARRLRPEVHLVLRTFSDVLADRLSEMFGIRTTYSTSALAGPTLAAASLIDGVRYAFYAGTQLFTVSNCVVTAAHLLAGKTVGQVLAAQLLIVLGIQRPLVDSVEVLPAHTTLIQAGDALTLLGPIEAIQQITGRQNPAA